MLMMTFLGDYWFLLKTESYFFDVFTFSAFDALDLLFFFFT